MKKYYQLWVERLEEDVIINILLPDAPSNGDEISFLGTTNSPRVHANSIISVKNKDGKITDPIAMMDYLENTVQGIVIICKRIDIAGVTYFRCKQW